MTEIITPSNITFVLGLLAIMFSVYLSFRNPQIKTDQVTIKLQDDIKSMQGEIDEIKEKHLTSVEANMKELSKTINDLALTVTRLSTVIDERIPRQSHA